MKFFPKGDLSEVMVCPTNFFWPKSHFFQKLLPFSYGGSMKYFLRGDLTEVMVCPSNFCWKKITFSKIITIFVWRKYKIFPKGGHQWSHGVTTELFWPKNHLFHKLLPFSYGGSMKFFLRGHLSEVMVCLSIFSGQKITFFTNYYHFRMEEVWKYS